MITCKEVSRAFASDELASMSWRQRLSVRLHLLMCRHCRRYARQVRAIGEAARRLFGGQSLEREVHERLRKSILDRALKSEDSSTE